MISWTYKDQILLNLQFLSMIECCGKKRVFEVNDLYLEPSSPHQNAIKLDRDTVVFSIFSRAGLGSKIVHNTYVNEANNFSSQNNFFGIKGYFLTFPACF